MCLRVRQKLTQKEKKQLLFQKGRLSLSLRMKHVRTINCFYKITFLYAYRFSLKIWDSSWHSFNELLDWNPNAFLFKRLSVRNLRRRMVQKVIIELPKQISASITTSLVISLLPSNVLLDTNERTKRYQIMAVYYPVCPMAKAQRGALFTYTEKTIIKFILKATISTYIAGGRAAEGNAATEALSKFITSSRNLSRKFPYACHPAFNTR